MPEALLALTTTSDQRQVLLDLAARLIELRLAACCQVESQPITSFYRWEDRLEQAQEFRCVIKTFERHQQAVCQTIRAQHNYDCPQIVATPLQVPDADYLRWARQACDLPAEEGA